MELLLSARTPDTRPGRVPSGRGIRSVNREIVPGKALKAHNLGGDMKRTYLAVLACGLAAASSAAWSQAQQRPQIETKKVDGTDNVYVFRNGNHQSMFVVTPAGVIATDPVAYGRPTGGQQYLDEIKKVTDKPVKFLIYSHHHYDHIAGGKAFKDAGAKIIAHKNAAVHMAPLKD